MDSLSVKANEHSKQRHTKASVKLNIVDKAEARAPLVDKAKAHAPFAKLGSHSL